MATYAIGDIQGCFKTLGLLLQKLDFHPERDRLWLVGDMVNRGPDSLGVLRWAKSLGEQLSAVLGNHDLHLLAVAEGIRAAKSRDTLDQVLGAPDREALLGWLRGRPLLYREGDEVLLHAGLLPAWSIEQAEVLAGEVGSALQCEKRRDLLEALYRDEPARPWSEELRGVDRLRVIANALATLRTCTLDGRPCEEFSGPPESAPPGCVPWFEVPERASRSATIVFGHWAALGLRLQPGIVALDTGCVWGGRLTALRLEDRAVFQVQSVEGR